MTKPNQMTKQELLDRYRDPGFRESALELMDLCAFLENCVIRGNYRIPDSLNNVLAISSYGEGVVRELAKSAVPIKEARLMCLLESWHLDYLVDPAEINAYDLAAAIGAEVASRRILLPFIHGPQLYERAAELFPDRRPHLGTRDTLRLLEAMPPGVFQSGRWVSGPYGLVQSSERRRLPPTLAVPLQHCSDVACHAIHAVRLNTDGTAPINVHRAAMRKILEEQNEDPSEFGAFLVEIGRDDKSIFDDFHRGSLALLIGDCFSDKELTTILAYLCDNTNGEAREAFGAFGLTGPSADWASARSRAETLQLLLLCTDEMLADALDALVFGNTLVVPEGEVRRPVLFPNAGTGAFDVHAELSALGLRFASRRDIAPVRLRRLIDQIYAAEGRTAGLDEAHELEWQLRGVPGVSVTSRLEEYLRTASPEDVLARLVLSRSENVEVAATALTLSPHLGLDDGVVISRMLWKLGFDCETVTTLHGRFGVLQERISHAARSAGVSTIVDQEAMRGLGANYFVALEKLLADTLAFAGWVFLADHIGAKKPFAYDSVSDGTWALAELTAFHETHVSETRFRHVFSEAATLQPLCEGFGILADMLEGRQKHASEDERAAAGYPEFAGKTDLQRFPFSHACAFLDLTPTSQTEIIGLLREVSRDLVSARVAEVRNEQLHYRRSSTDLEKFLLALDAVHRSVGRLEDAGLTRTLFYPDRRETDRWGRRTVYFSDRNGREIALGRPSPYTWLNLPLLSEPQYIVSVAQFAEPNEMLRVELSTASEFTAMWSNIPLRRERSQEDGALRPT